MLSKCFEPFIKPCHPKLIGHLDSLAGSNLKFPLSGHGFSIGTCNLYPSIETSTIMSFNDIPSISSMVPNSTRINTLRTWVSLFWPSIRMTVRIQHCPLLFHPKPGLFGLGFWHGFVTGKSMICLVGIFIKVKTFTKNKNIWLATKRVWKNSNWLEKCSPIHPFRNFWNILYKAFGSFWNLKCKNLAISVPWVIYRAFSTFLSVFHQYYQSKYTSLGIFHELKG